MTNALEAMLAESIEKGRQEGRQEGRAEGWIEAKRDSLRKIIEQRFGAVPQALEARIARADADALDAMLVSAAMVARAEDL